MNDMAVRIEQQLERISSEKNRLDAILTGMGEGVMVTDQSGVVTLVNPAFCSMFGTGPQVQGSQLLEISRHPDLYAACRQVLTEREERHQEISLPGGQATLVHWVPLVESGSLRGVVAVFHDISALKKVERIRRDFVANVSHELRTPVTVIKGYAETLLSGALEDDPQRRERFLEIIQNHADRLSTLVRDLLTLSVLQSGEVAMKPQNLLDRQRRRHQADHRADRRLRRQRQVPLRRGAESRPRQADPHPDRDGRGGRHLQPPRCRQGAEAHRRDVADIFLGKITSGTTRKSPRTTPA